MINKFLSHNIKKNERGQSMVELAISLIVILTLLAGAVDFGIALYSYVALRDAVQEGALYGSFEPTLDDGDGVYEGESLNTVAIEQRVRSASSNPVDLSDTTNVSIDVKILPDGAAPCEGPQNYGVYLPSGGAGIQVSATYNYTLSMPFLSGIIGTNIVPITASVTDTILRPLCP